MNYQRACRNGGCYQNIGNVQRMASRYTRCERDPVFYGKQGGIWNSKEQMELKLPEATSLAMVYSPVQTWRDIYDIDYALERGTLFAELDKPLNSAGR